MASLIPTLRHFAPRLTRQYFQCAHYQSPARIGNGVQVLRRIACARTSSKIPGPALTSKVISRSNTSIPITALNEASPKAQKQYFPETSEKSVAYWLLGSAVSVFGIVVFGGLTRLTESGLSITEWRPVTGSLPPTSTEQWEVEFNKYRSSPEFKVLNPNMTMEEFKSIYYMEWTHRLWGRVVGISFVLPAAYFIARRKISRPMAVRVSGIGGLIAFQGFLGWWMVKSGLRDDLFSPGSHPRVSQYRLVAHLGTAFMCYSAMLWNGLIILRKHKFFGNLEYAEDTLSRLRDPRLRFFRGSIGALAVLVFVTAMSGGLVAGLDAGLIYNEFPKMGLGLAPPRSELFSDFYSHTPDKSDLWWRNFLENPSLVQLDHRILATTTFTAVMSLFAYSRLSPALKRLLPRDSSKAVHGVFGFALLQVALGITTLLYLVPVPLASAHQAGSLALLSYVFILGSRTWLPNQRVAKQLTARLNGARKAGRTHATPRVPMSKGVPK